MFSEYDIVRLRSTGTILGIPIGTLGTVLLIYPDTPPSYEVEFMGYTGDTFTISERELEFVKKG